MLSHIGTILHPWQRDTGKYAAQGSNIMLPEAPLMPPEVHRAELEGRGRHQGGRGRYNVARGRHIFQWHEARGVILTLLYRQADIDIGHINRTEIQYAGGQYWIQYTP